MPGVVKVVRNGDFVGVIGAREEQALAAHARLQTIAQWDVPKTGETQDTVHAWMLTQPEKLTVIKDQPNKAVPADAQTVEAAYKRPYHMHASIGTSTSIAVLDTEGVTHVDSHSQAVFELGAAIAEMLGGQDGAHEERGMSPIEHIGVQCAVATAPFVDALDRDVVVTHLGCRHWCPVAVEHHTADRVKRTEQPGNSLSEEDRMILDCCAQLRMHVLHRAGPGTLQQSPPVAEQLPGH
jgi:hypothetical protein